MAVQNSKVLAVLCACVMTLFKCTSGSSQRSIMYGNDVEHVCMPLQIKFCEDVLLYNHTFVPNLLFHSSQDEAQMGLFEFKPLININCSETMKQFLCLIYAPPCTATKVPVPVCKSLCEMAFTKDCRRLMSQASIQSIVLDCSRYPSSGLCITPDQVSSGKDGSGGRDVTPLNPFVKGPDSYISESGSSESIDSSVNVDLFLLVTSGAEIQLLNFKGSNTMDTITIHRRVDEENNPAIDVYLPKRYIYWASNIDAKICRGTLENDQMYNIRNLIDTGASTVTSIAVDWNLKVLFWSEIFNFPAPQIRTSSLSGRGITTVIKNDLVHPICLTLDPAEGRIFWIDKKGTLRQPHATIESYSIVSQTRELIRNISSLSTRGGGRPSALLTDVEDKRLFWVDSRSKSLHSMNYDGSNHMTILEDNERLNDPESIIIKGDYLYWMYRNALMRVNKHNGSDELLIKVFERNPPQSLRLYEDIPNDESNYDRSTLTKTWRDLSSSESMEDKPVYDDDYYYEDTTPTKKADTDSKSGRASCIGVHTGISLVIVGLIVSVRLL